MKDNTRGWRIALIAVLLAGGGYAAWQRFKPAELPDGIAAGNGRIEAVEIDIATRSAGRIREILVNEGDFLTAGQIIAHMDTVQLRAQRREAEAQLKRAFIGVETSRSQVSQREAELEAAKAVIAQREAEFDAAQKKLQRTEQLADRGNASEQTRDDDRARAEGARAAVSAAKAQSAASAAAIGAAGSQVIAAEASVVAAQATIDRIDAELADSVLKAPRDGRVQYRVAQPGEVLPAGGRVLNMVDLGDVYMTFFLPTEEAGRVAFGAEARIVLDAAPRYVIPATISLVADVAQFTPKTVETAKERQKLMFRIKARIAPELLRKYVQHVKTGLPGMAYVKIDPAAQWPARLQDGLVK